MFEGSKTTVFYLGRVIRDLVHSPAKFSNDKTMGNYQVALVWLFGEGQFLAKFADSFMKLDVIFREGMFLLNFLLFPVFKLDVVVQIFRVENQAI